jgi:hypothetical protein
MGQAYTVTALYSPSDLGLGDFKETVEADSGAEAEFIDRTTMMFNACPEIEAKLGEEVSERIFGVDRIEDIRVFPELESEDAERLIRVHRRVHVVDCAPVMGDEPR